MLVYSPADAAYNTWCSPTDKHLWGWGKRADMSTAKPRKAQTHPAAPIFGELDRVKLKRAVSTEARDFDPGMMGTIVHCHGTQAYEVEFDGIDDFFQIAAEDLAKI